VSIVTFPAACALQLAGLSLGQQRFDITEQSDGNGNTATRLGAPPRWRANLRSLPAMVAADAARWKALQLGLRGRINHLALWDITNPQPRGTARGSITLASTAAAGAVSIALAGTVNSNVLPGGSFEIDSNADGLADGWSRYSAGTFTTLTQVRSSGLTFHGSWSQALDAATLGSTAGDRQGITRSGISIAALAGLNACFSATVLGTLNSSIHIELAWRDGGGTVISSIGSGPVALTTGVQVISTTGVCPANAVTCIVYIYQSTNTGASPGFYVDGVQIAAGSAPQPFPGFPTLLAGDWLQIGTGVGSHYCMVTADATATDAGAITVSIEPPLRQAISSGAAVAWDKPLCHFKQTADGASWDAVPGSSDVGGFALDLIEDWRA
jgi:hypothetical protein